MLDLGRLRVLRELKLRGTAGAVADALGYSPSAVSQQLAQLQREVGVPLVERVGRRLRLTDAGEVLAERARTLLAEAERAEEAALAASGRVAGTVRVVGFQTALLNVVVPSLPGLAAAYPELRIDVRDEEDDGILDRLASQEIDVALTDEHPYLPRAERPELDSEVLITEPMGVVLPAAHPLAAAAGPVPLADLAAEAWVAPYATTNHAAQVERACLELGGFRPDVRHRSNDLRVIFGLIRAAGAVGIVPHLAGAADEPGMVVRAIAGAPLHRRMELWRRAGADVRPSVRAVLDALRGTADALVAARPGLVRGRGE
ncbi:HTH-type transcriptional regulator CynR [Actinomadura rubteroloni]|uniref:HTH-type transcriptional regulator CynR n=1 Tax=Actinomadura rubteroloni TaxID=1926885 RepID=A0A2P4UPL9_9ACTN|nr:LysR family transcriptional regulator [Actinomadura rubteroloni]POM26964.1 HTH-type transcriptional regulator CynR [Actinomadura rubteroloni]